MQYLLLEGDETLTSLSKRFGQSTTSDILAENGIARTPNVAKQWRIQCQAILDSGMKEVSPERKLLLLNSLTSNDDVFEKACLMDEDEWKIFSVTQAFTDALKVPESVYIPYSANTIGSAASQPVSRKSGKSSSALPASSSNAVPASTYKAVANSLRITGAIDPTIFDDVNTGLAVPTKGKTIQATSSVWSYNLPWGKILMYSTVLQESIEFPVYPEQIDMNRQASYTSMPDIIYQYEPWITFQNSGPREQELSFHMHRDMWSGDHRDGRANKLIRFCEANTFADYNGSAVITPLVRLYIDGALFISGVIKSTHVNWSGPIGLDNWYLEFTLSLGMQEISETELNCKKFYKRKLKEG